MLNRRKFLWYSLAGASSLLMSFEYISKVTNLEMVISKILLKNLQGLKINPAETKNYARDVVSKNALNFSFANVQLICLYQMYGVEPFLFPFYKKYARISTDITANFLLSTDFFINKMDEQKHITYSGSVYNIYNTACANPFSGLFYKA